MSKENQAGSNHDSHSTYSRAIHGLSVVLTIAVFPLIWVGGLVTTYDAGMAVPDWPGTYGWNMFAYPASTWLFGPFDLMVEHSHRLLGTVAGFLSIGLVIATRFWEERAWFRWWAIGVLVAVIAQGALGGARVLLDQRTFAMIHGCTGPLFFAIATATAVMSSRWWRRLFSQEATERGEKTSQGGGNSTQTESSEAKQGGSGRDSAGMGLTWIATSLVLASYVQLIVGAQLRHVTGLVGPKLFTAFVHTHLTLAGLVLILALFQGVMACLGRQTPRQVSRTAYALLIVVLVQLTLGIGTWIVNYALPWPELNDTLAGYTIAAKGFWESLIVTAHMATGSLIISLATVVALRAWRSRQNLAPAAN